MASLAISNEQGLHARADPDDGLAIAKIIALRIEGRPLKAIAAIITSKGHPISHEGVGLAARPRRSGIGPSGANGRGRAVTTGVRALRFLKSRTPCEPRAHPERTGVQTKRSCTPLKPTLRP